MNKKAEYPYLFVVKIKPVSYTHLDVYKRQASAGAVSVDSDPVVVCLPSSRHRRVVRYLPVDERDTGLQLYRQHRHRHAGNLI